MGVGKGCWFRGLPGLRLGCASGKSGFYLLTLERAYHNLTTVLSIVKSNVAKPNRAWAKPSLPMNLTYPRLIPAYSGLGLSVDLSNILSESLNKIFISKTDEPAPWTLYKLNKHQEARNSISLK